MTEREKVIIKEIHRNLSHASSLLEELSTDTRNKIETLHHERFTLAHCIRWGENAISEIRDEFRI